MRRRFFVAFRVVAVAYEAILADRGDALPVERPLFQTYIDYEQKVRQSARYAKSGQYWERKLTPGPDPLRFNGKLPVKKTTKSTRISIDLGQELSSRLREAAQQKSLFSVNVDLTLYNIFGALFFIHLQKLSQKPSFGRGDACS